MSLFFFLTNCPDRRPVVWKVNMAVKLTFFLIIFFNFFVHKNFLLTIINATEKELPKSVRSLDLPLTTNSALNFYIIDLLCTFVCFNFSKWNWIKIQIHFQESVWLELSVHNVAMDDNASTVRNKLEIILLSPKICLIYFLLAFLFYTTSIVIFSSFNFCT